MPRRNAELARMALTRHALATRCVHLAVTGLRVNCAGKMSLYNCVRNTSRPARDPRHRRPHVHPSRPVADCPVPRPPPRSPPSPLAPSFDRLSFDRLSLLAGGDGQVVRGGGRLGLPRIEEDGDDDERSAASEDAVGLEVEERDRGEAREEDGESHCQVL